MVQGLPMLVLYRNGVCMTVLHPGLGEWPQGEAAPWMQALAILDNRVLSPPRQWEMGEFVPVQPSNSLGLSQGLQGTCSSFQQGKHPPISRRAFQPDKAMQAASFLQLG